jgi:hypothetical protein
VSAAPTVTHRPARLRRVNNTAPTTSAAAARIRRTPLATMKSGIHSRGEVAPSDESDEVRM